MKINKLEIENVKRIKAVKLEPTANGLTVIGGRNNQGKTSVLDSIAWALGGENFRPSDATREGSIIPPNLKIVLNNGLIVERKGKNSALKVTDPSGQKAGQSLLNTFVESLALNLPKFMESSGKEKAQTLLQIIGVGNQLAELEKEEKELVKAAVVQFLKENLDMEEEDFLSAELEIVPAGKARDCGLDRSMVIGYGQDDRVCAFTSLFAMLETENPERTSCCILVDKEEIGSVGATGMHSRFFEDYVAELMALTEDGNPLKVRRALRNSYMLSSDVSAAFDPLYADAFEKKNTAYFGRGLVFNKFTGSRGKNNSNDANAEYIAKVRQVLDNNEVGFQTAEMGRVDLGGGGTIAYIMANYGMNVIDSGVAVLSMHAPYEVTSKADIYEAYRGYKAFLKDIK
mgnify:CR=1 FL=1